LTAYKENRSSQTESFVDFASRHSDDQLVAFGKA